MRQQNLAWVRQGSPSDISHRKTPRPGYSSAAKSALLDGSELRHGSARTRIQRIHPELYAIGAACKCMGQQQVLRSRIHHAATNFRCVTGTADIDAAKLFFGSNIAGEADAPTRSDDRERNPGPQGAVVLNASPERIEMLSCHREGVERYPDLRIGIRRLAQGLSMDILQWLQPDMLVLQNRNRSGTWIISGT
jgi:hypothetical protein